MTRWREVIFGALAVGVASACSTPASTSHSEAATAPSTTSTTPAPSGAPHLACATIKDAQTVHIARGATARTSLDIAITYHGTEQDSYEGGRTDTDTLAKLTFQGVLDNGELTPSALSWLLSAREPPAWVHLGSMPLCVRISDARQQGITVELFRETAQ